MWTVGVLVVPAGFVQNEYGNADAKLKLAVNSRADTNLGSRFRTRFMA
jgi:hypothetical protein